MGHVVVIKVTPQCCRGDAWWTCFQIWIKSMQDASIRWMWHWGNTKKTVVKLTNAVYRLHLLRWWKCTRMAASKLAGHSKWLVNGVVFVIKASQTQHTCTGSNFTRGLHCIGAGARCAVRSKCYVNGAATPLKILRQIGSSLVDVNGQNASTALRSSATQLALLDRIAGTLRSFS